MILRPVHVIGPHLDNLVSRFLRQQNVPTLPGFDPTLQLRHEDAFVARRGLSDALADL